MLTHELRVRYVECDMQGRVFNAHYLTWTDMAHAAFWGATVGPYAEFLARGLDIVVAESNLRFLAPCGYDDLVSIDVTADPLGTTSMTSHMTMRLGDREAAQVRIRHVCVDRRTMTKAPWPEDVRAALG